MNDSPQTTGAWPSRFAAIIFGVTSLLLLPVILLGYGLWIARFLFTRSLGVSKTAQSPLAARWLLHRLGQRRDEAANRLLMVLPGVSPLAVWLVFGPLLLAKYLSGYVPQDFRYPFKGDIALRNQPVARQTFYDSVVERHLADVTQCVILGSGFDTRAWRLSPERQARVRCFEVDAPRTQAIKLEALRVADLDTTGITFVSADFEQEDWLAKLIASGFDPDQPTLFLWEGVTMYLSEETVKETLRKIASLAPGSIVAFGYFTTEILQSRALLPWLSRALLRAIGEPLKFGIDSTPPPVCERMAEFLRSCGLSPSEQQVLGSEKNGQRAWGGFATAWGKSF